MELLRQGLRISIHGSGDHSGDLWTGSKSTATCFAVRARFSVNEQWQKFGLPAIAVKGDTPR